MRKNSAAYPYRCAVPGCNTNPFKNPVLTFHRLPPSGKLKVTLIDKLGRKVVMDERKAWISKLKISEEAATENAKVCSKHFLEKDYLTNAVRFKKRLKRGIVPSRNLELERLVKPTRQSSTKSTVNEMDQKMNIKRDLEGKNSDYQEISEGLAKIKTKGNVFYNPVQEFNRDLSISVITAFADLYKNEQQTKNGSQNETITIIVDGKSRGLKIEEGIPNGLYILEALSATGLRSIRYAKEIPGVKEIVANDISSKAVDDITRNINENDVTHLVTPSLNDATMLMYQHRKEEKFDVIDLDPYGCPSIFLDSAVQAVKEGGLLLVTATDMAVLAGNSPETCYSKYGAVSLRIKSCHEMAIRILLQCIEGHANRYGRFIVPLLSLSADFYIRVFVRVYSGAHKCKFTTSKLASVYHCTGCDSFELQPLGVLRQNERNDKQVKFCLPTGPPVLQKCVHCNGSYHIGGPIWAAPIHSPHFVQTVLSTCSEKLGTYKRIQGVLSVISEELQLVPLYYTLERLSATLHVAMPPMMSLRSAILNAGFEVSFTHANKTSVKTNAPSKVVWDIMRCWEKKHPVAKKRLIENTPAFNILSKEPEKEYSFEAHPQANPNSRKMGFVRFQENPQPHWGPGSRATAMVGEQKITKSKMNQGKRKREPSEEIKIVIFDDSGETD